jgi:hypothetical protein
MPRKNGRRRRKVVAPPKVMMNDLASQPRNIENQRFIRHQVVHMTTPNGCSGHHRNRSAGAEKQVRKSSHGANGPFGMGPVLFPV